LLGAPKLKKKKIDCNSEQVEEVDLDNIVEYTEMLDVDELAAAFDRLEREAEFVLID